jgi:Fur family zinc uptake transcriptional regulator
MTASEIIGAFHPHDHGRCRADARSAVDAECRERGLRLTPARACVLEALLESHRALTAYELLDRLREAGLGSQPPVAYRALDFLVANGFAHRIERLSAFVACSHAGADHAAAFLICRNCRGVAEAILPQVEAGLADSAAREGFAVERTVIEGEGLCAGCREALA